MPSREQGSALAVTLFVMLAALALGVSAAQAALSAEKSARAERDRQLALAAAEAALGDAERDIEGAAGAGSERASYFEPGDTAAFVDGCGQRREANAGLCRYSPTAPAWKSADLAEDGQAARSVPYGAFTGAAMRVGAGPLPSRLPRYIIEPLPVQLEGEDAAAPMPGVYRITALGFGARDATRVVLQTVYRKAAS